MSFPIPTSIGHDSSSLPIFFHHNVPLGLPLYPLDLLHNPNNEVQLFIELHALDIPLTTQNNHSMTTRSKLGITKTKPLAYHVKLSPTPSGNFRITHLQVPQSISHTLKTLEWYEAIKLEIEALLQNGTQELIEFPKDTNLLGVNGVFG